MFTNIIYEKTGNTLTAKGLNNAEWLGFWKQYLAKLTSMSEEEQLMLLATHGMLVKRPMVITHDIVLVGFKEADWEGDLL